MYPENKSARSKLTNKLNENIIGSGNSELQVRDLQLIKEILSKHADELKIDLSTVTEGNG